MNRRIYKTAQGISIDVDQLRLVNEGVVAVGNMGVNARGDIVNADGTIKESRNALMKKTYRTSAVTAGSARPAPRVPTTDTDTKVVGTNVSQTTANPASVSNTPLRGSLASSVATPRSVEDVSVSTPEKDLLAPTETVSKITRI